MKKQKEPLVRKTCTFTPAMLRQIEAFAERLRGERGGARCDATDAIRVLVVRGLAAEEG